MKTTRADKRKFHYIYKITRINSDKYYIGMHSTDNLDDEYFGSGTLLWKSINKYGKESHSKQILEFCNSREQLRIREKEIIGDLYRTDEHCMNMKAGGEGGGIDGLKLSEDHKRKLAKSWASKTKEEKALTDDHKRKISEALKGKIMPPRNDEWRRKQRESQLGKRDPETGFTNKSRAQSGANNPRAKTWKLLNEQTLETILITGLKPWCKANGYSFALLLKTQQTKSFYHGLQLIGFA